MRFKKGRVPWNKGLKGWNSGHVCSEETRRKISEAVKKENPISSANELARQSAEYKTWRASVFNRDNYACRECGYKKNLHPHHIKEFSKYPDLRFVVDNGITLCAVCHGKIHGIDFEKRLQKKGICVVCGDEFYNTGGHTKKTCSRVCAQKIHGTRKGKHYSHLKRVVVHICKCCGKEFTKQKELNGKKGGSNIVEPQYCNRGCYLKFRWSK